MGCRPVPLTTEVLNENALTQLPAGSFAFRPMKRYLTEHVICAATKTKCQQRNQEHLSFDRDKPLIGTRGYPLTYTQYIQKCAAIGGWQVVQRLNPKRKHYEVTKLQSGYGLQHCNMIDGTAQYADSNFWGEPNHVLKRGDFYTFFPAR